MEVTLTELERDFREAREVKYNYFAVVVCNKDMKHKEIIANPMDNLEEKLEYYKKAYTEDLILKANNKIRITGWVVFDKFYYLDKCFDSLSNEE